MYECVKNNVPFVLAGSLRRRWPLPETITDMEWKRRTPTPPTVAPRRVLVLCLGIDAAHSIATGNMLPSWVKIVCVDINPAVAHKVSDRGTGSSGRRRD